MHFHPAAGADRLRRLCQKTVATSRQTVALETRNLASLESVSAQILFLFPIYRSTVYRYLSVFLAATTSRVGVSHTEVKETPSCHAEAVSVISCYFNLLIS